MKRIALLLLLAAAALHADDLTKNVQTSLKELGFYYGEVTGAMSPETTAAIRRYQIRNGLEVTGSLNDETKQALGFAAAPAVKKDAPIDLRHTDTEADSDRSFLRQEAKKTRSYRDPATVNPPAPLPHPPDPGAADYTHIFASTPYEIAPPEVQSATFRKAQGILARRGFYRGVIDSTPGPATEEALLGYQRQARLTLSGRLDLATLGAMDLLPGRADGPPMRPFTIPPGSRASPRVLRGVWVN